MRILFILDQPYPHGMACTKRVHLYAKGLKELDNNVKIIVPKPKDKWNSINNENCKGIYEGIKYQYAPNTTVRSKHFLFRRFFDLFGLINTINLSLKYSPDIIILTGESYLLIAIIKIISIISKSFLIREKSEIPLLKKNKLSQIDLKIQKLAYSMFDGIIAISNNLAYFFKNTLKFRNKIIKIPIITEINNQSNFNENNITKSFVYSGSLVNKKDGVILIIRAFSILNKKYHKTELVLTGSLYNSPDKNKIIDTIENLGLKEKVTLPGYISKYKLKRLRNSALALVVAKPRNRQNKYNMATKISEYLGTGRPIIISSLETACEYLEHMESALISEPSAKSFAKQMEYIIQNPYKANKIGMNGKQVAKKYFNYKHQITKLNHFFKEM